MANEHARKCLRLISLEIWDMQVKTKMRCHFSPTRLAKMKMSIHVVCLWECSDTKTLIYSWWDVAQPFWKVIWPHLWKWKMCIPYDPGGVPLTGLQHRETVTRMLQKACTWMWLQHSRKCWDRDFVRHSMIYSYCSGFLFCFLTNTTIWFCECLHLSAWIL